MTTTEDLGNRLERMIEKLDRILVPYFERRNEELMGRIASLEAAVRENRRDVAARVGLARIKRDFEARRDGLIGDLPERVEVLEKRLKTSRWADTSAHIEAQKQKFFDEIERMAARPLRRAHTRG